MPLIHSTSSSSGHGATQVPCGLVGEQAPDELLDDEEAEVLLAAPPVPLDDEEAEVLLAAPPVPLDDEEAEVLLAAPPVPLDDEELVLEPGGAPPIPPVLDAWAPPMPPEDDTAPVLPPVPLLDETDDDVVRGTMAPGGAPPLPPPMMLVLHPGATAQASRANDIPAHIPARCPRAPGNEEHPGVEDRSVCIQALVRVPVLAFTLACGEAGAPPPPGPTCSELVQQPSRAPRGQGGRRRRTPVRRRRPTDASGCVAG